MYCLDSDLVIAFLRGYPDAVAKINNFLASKIELAVTPLTLCELYRGAFLSKDAGKNVTLINNFIYTTILLEHNRESCQYFGEDYAALKKSGLQTQEMDLLIASICKAHRCILVTRNTKDFKNIKGLLLQKW